MTRDGKLAVIHDASLKRTCGVDLKIEDLTLAGGAGLSAGGKRRTHSRVLRFFASGGRQGAVGRGIESGGA